MPPKQLINKTKPWTKEHILKYNWLYNWYIKNYDNEANKETFIDDNDRRAMG